MALARHLAAAADTACMRIAAALRLIALAVAFGPGHPNGLKPPLLLTREALPAGPDAAAKAQ
jgi:hypothetical protein